MIKKTSNKCCFRLADDVAIIVESMKKLETRRLKIIFNDEVEKINVKINKAKISDDQRYFGLDIKFGCRKFEWVLKRKYLR